MSTDLACQLEARANIDALEAKMREMVASGEHEAPLHDGATTEGQDECSHYFGDRVYVRSILIPAGTTVVGKLHKQRRVCLILQGECIFMDEHRREQVKAPYIGEFEAGCKTAVFALTDTLWAACVGTEMTDPQEIIEKITTTNHEEYFKQLEAQ